MADEGLCSSCSNSIWCDTWGEYRCSVLEKRIYNYKELTKCDNYVKRSKDWKEPRCQCRSCLVNEKLLDDLEVGKHA